MMGNRIMDGPMQIWYLTRKEAEFITDEYCKPEYNARLHPPILTEIVE